MGVCAALWPAAGPPADVADAVYLIRHAGGDDGAAFAALLARHGPAVWAVCRRLLGTGPDAEDAFQAAFVALAREAARLTGRRSVAAWLHRVARNGCLNLRRGERRRVGRESSAQGRPVTPPDAAAEAAELRRDIDDAVAALPPRLRETFVMCAIEGTDARSAAARLGCAVGTVESRLTRARKELRKRLPDPATLTSSVIPIVLYTGVLASVTQGPIMTRIERLAAAATASPRWPVVALLGLTLASLGLLTAVAGAPPAKKQPAPLARLGSERFRHPAVAPRLRFSPDGKRVAGFGSVADGDNAPVGHLLVWDRATGRRVAHYRFADGWPADVRYAADGRSLIVLQSTFDGRLTATRIDGNVRKPFFRAMASKYRQARLSPAGTWAAAIYPTEKPSACDLRIFDLKTGKTVKHRLPVGDAWLANFDKAGRHLLLIADRHLWAIDGSGRVRLHAETAGMAAGPFTHKAASLSADGKTVVAALGNRDAMRNAHLTAWDVTTGKRIAEFGRGKFWQCPQVMPGGRFLAAEVDPPRLWRFGRDGEPVGKPAAVCMPFYGRQAVLPGGEQILSHEREGRPRRRTQLERTLGMKSADQSWPRVRLRRPDGTLITELPPLHADGRRPPVASPDGRFVALSGFGAVTLIDAQLGRIVSHSSDPEGLVHHLHFLKGGRLLAVAGGEAIVWDWRRGKQVRRFRVTRNSTVRVAVSPDGRELAACRIDGLRLYDIATGARRRELPVGDGFCVGLEYSRGGKELIGHMQAGWRDGSPVQRVVWDLADGGVTSAAAKGFKMADPRRAESPDGRRVAAFRPDGTVVVSDAKTGRAVHEFAGRHLAAGVLTFSSDGQRLASSSADSAVYVWNLTD